MTDGYPYEMLLPCWCGDRPILEIHDNHYWVSCSCESWKHDMLVPDYPEVGGSDGFDTDEQAVMAWNKLMSERMTRTMPDETDTFECVCDQMGRYGKRITVHVMECPECGRTYEHVNGDYERCPHCGVTFGGK